MAIKRAEGAGSVCKRGRGVGWARGNRGGRVTDRGGLSAAFRGISLGGAENKNKKWRSGIEENGGK